METRFDDGVTVDEVDTKFTIKVDAIGAEVRYCSAEAGTGYRYAVTVSDLPVGALEGGPLLVTVTSPWVDAWALQGDEDRALHENYVREHLCGGPTRRVSDADVRALTLLVRHALNRHKEH